MPDLGLRAMVSCLTLDEMVSLDSAMLHHECRRELMEALRGTAVFGSKFTYRLPQIRPDEMAENPDELRAALEWTEKREIVALDFTLKLPYQFANKVDHIT